MDKNPTGNIIVTATQGMMQRSSVVYHKYQAGIHQLLGYNALHNETGQMNKNFKNLITKYHLIPCMPRQRD